MEFLHDTNIWVLLSFIVFIVALVKIAKDKVLALLDKRIDEIRKEIGTAESLRIEAQELLAQYQRKQRDAAKEAGEIIAKANEHAAEIQKQAEKDLKEIARRREQQLQERLNRMEQTARHEIQTYAAELAVKATMEIITRKMDKKTNENLINQSIKDVAKKMA